MLKLEPPVPQNATILGTRSFKEAIKSNEAIRMGSNPM